MSLVWQADENSSHTVEIARRHYKRLEVKRLVWKVILRTAIQTKTVEDLACALICLHAALSTRGLQWKMKPNH